MPSALFDVAGAFNAGVAARAGVEQIQQQRERQRLLELDADRKAQIAGARQMYAQGVKSPLAALDPEQFGRLEEQGFKIQKAETDLRASERQQKRQMLIDQSEFMDKAISLALERPESWQAIKEQAAQSGLFPEEYLNSLSDQVPPPEVLQKRLAEARAFRAFIDDEKYSDEVREVAMLEGIEPWQVQGNKGAVQRLEQLFESKIKGRTKPGVQVQIQQGVSPLAKGAETKIQTDIIREEALLRDLDAVATRTKAEFLGYAGRLKGRLGEVADKMGLVSSATSFGQYVKDREAWKNEVGQIFAEWRKYITGAAAAEKELRQLRDVFIHEDLGQTQFEGRMEQLQEKISRAIRLKRKVLAQGGIQTKEEMGQRIDELWQQGDQGTGGDMEKLRMQQLEQSGLAPDQQLAQMALEGYITQEEADAALQNLGP